MSNRLGCPGEFSVPQSVAHILVVSFMLGHPTSIAALSPRPAFFPVGDVMSGVVLSATSRRPSALTSCCVVVLVH